MTQTPSSSRSHMATRTCTIYRVALNGSTGVTEWPSAHLADISCTPLMARGEGMMSAGRPQSDQMADTVQHELIVFGNYDIKKGDVLDLDGTRYQVWDKHLWKISDPFMLIVLSDIQATMPSQVEFIR